jgi:hypothetical protein
VSTRTTLKDVAREAGVHISTASRALNPSTASIVNPETVERVTDAARKLGYRPHPLARGLRTNRTMSVGVIIPDVENPLFGPIIAGVESVLVEEDYSVLIGNADRGPSHADSLVEDMLEKHVDEMSPKPPRQPKLRSPWCWSTGRSTTIRSRPSSVMTTRGSGWPSDISGSWDTNVSATWPGLPGYRQATGAAKRFSIG